MGSGVPAGGSTSGGATEALRAALPSWARDTARNVEAVLDEPRLLTADQHWGTVLVAATVLRQRTGPLLAETAAVRLEPSAADTARAVASVMAGHAVLFRARHFLHGAYDDVRAGLRSSATVAPTWPRADVEAWCVAAAAVLGCQACLEEHEAAARDAGLDREQVHEVLRIAAVVAAAVTAVEA
jgi:alkyl hydroperoxide reductase subunit D